MEKNPVTPKLVVIGGSAGSLTVLFQVLPELRPSFPYTLVLVLHRKGGSDSHLVDLLNAKCTAPVIEVEDKEALQIGQIYLAPSDYHLLLEDRATFCLDDDEKIHYSRPSIDVTFESAAHVFGKDTVGILLSGANDDGSEGLARIRAAGGMAIVQDPNSAQMPVMPQVAIDKNHYDYVADIDQIRSYLNQLS
ncbi:chemotaxis protein CheB [Dyadobacter tibetensis]|uniref:chemotaxis protein CheB n=1 Tax=Dyadobacter tibetensis TaxID=1211851 RepID=UPI0004722519|nr:chemotaxis protein CheB [Dyadobacter tibetensis]